MRPLDPPLQIVEQVPGRGDAGIGLEQRRFQILVHRVVDGRADERLREVRAGLAQSGAQLGQPVAAILALRLRAPGSPRARRRAGAAVVVGTAAVVATPRQVAATAMRVAERPATTRARAATALRAQAPPSMRVPVRVRAHRPASCRRTARRHRRSAIPSRCAAGSTGPVGHPGAAPGSPAVAGVSAAGGFLRKKLNMERRRPRFERRAATEGASEGERLPGLKPVVILVGSGALAQSVRATES